MISVTELLNDPWIYVPLLLFVTAAVAVWIWDFLKEGKQ